MATPQTVMLVCRRSSSWPVSTMLSRPPTSPIAVMSASRVSRPGMWVMMVQCFAMSDAFIKATEVRMHWSQQLLVNIATAAFLALSEMYLIGGILS